MQNSKEQGKPDIRNQNLSKMKNKIIIMSGKGGVGKSTVSVNVAYSLAALGYKTGILDVDFHGPSVAKMTGIEDCEIENSSSGRPMPVKAEENIFILSIASLLKTKDEAVIWRGPMKIGVIQQFFDEFEWPELDFLIIDCPPGTGDEPLSVIQTIGDVTGSIIVSTPQDIAFLDARKTITFSKKLNVPIIGIIENMSGFICPKCGERIDIFKNGGALKAKADFNVEILGHIPIEPEIVESGDRGKPYSVNNKKEKGAEIFMEITKKIISKVDENSTEKKNPEVKDGKDKIAIPVDKGILSSHFGHAEVFAVYYIENGAIIKKEELTPPPHEPGVIPKWLNEIKATKIITGGIGQSAINLFNGFGITVFCGAPVITPDDLIQLYLKDELKVTGSVCDHEHQH
ncbi:MAG: P-loop NTPase [Spirochaetes bacterium]|nr:P-loop NTPase [Spirochaetota bacterium]